MANWQASLLMQTLSTGVVLVLQRDKTDDPFGGTVMERHEGRAVVEVNQKRYHLHKAQPHETNDDESIEQPHEYWVID
jgi:hypothetical protein